jgi:large subunit ribosomal protein L7Ae
MMIPRFWDRSENTSFSCALVEQKNEMIQRSRYMPELSEEQMDEAYNVVEVARSTGKIRKGTNEVTKAIEREQAQLVIVAKDASPAELIMHIKPLCDEKKIPCVEVNSKEELGTAAGLPVASVSIAVVDAGEAKDKLKLFTEKKSE